MRYVNAEKPVTTNHEKLGKLEFAVEVPEAQSLAEAITMCGGEQQLVDFFNGQLATNAKNTARQYARTYEVAEGADTTQYPSIIKGIESKAQQLAHDYTPAADTERGPSKAKKANAYDAIANLVNSGQEFTKEQLLALLAQ